MAKSSIRYFLTFSGKDIKRPVLWEMSRKYEVIYDIRTASVGPELGIIALELSGEAKVVESAVAWLRKQGVQVDPVF